MFVQGLEVLTSYHLTHVTATSPDTVGHQLMAGVMLFELLSNNSPCLRQSQNCRNRCTAVLSVNEFRRDEKF